MTAIIQTMLDAAFQSIDQLKARISNVKWAPFVDGKDAISFDLDGQQYLGILRGRNRDLVIGLNADADKSVACRVLLDGDASINGK